MKHALLRMLSVLVLMGLLASSAIVPLAAQDTSPPPEGLATLCEANAPDDDSLATCLDIVETILIPSGEGVRLVTVPTADEFMAEMTALLPPQASIEAGKLDHLRRYADQTREYLLSVTPDPCYDNMYASAWGVATALQQWADRALMQPAPLLFNTYSQFVESPQAISCGEPVTGE